MPRGVGKRPRDVLGSVPLSLGNVVARVTAEARLKKHQDFSKTWGRSIYGSLGKVFARVTGALAVECPHSGAQAW